MKNITNDGLMSINGGISFGWLKNIFNQGFGSKTSSKVHPSTRIEHGDLVYE